MLPNLKIHQNDTKYLKKRKMFTNPGNLRNAIKALNLKQMVANH